MPITVEDFDRGRVNLADYLLRALRAMPGLAFTEAELREEMSAALGGLQFDDTDFHRVLAIMEGAGTITSKDLSGQVFWALSPSERGREQ